jgi:hypothetical protein
LRIDPAGASLHLYLPECVVGAFCELRLGGVLRLSQRVLRFSRHSAPFRGSEIVPTRLSFLSRVPKRRLTRIYVGIPQVDCSLVSAALGKHAAMSSRLFPRSSFTVFRQMHGRSFLRTSGFRSRRSLGRGPPDRSGALIHALGSLCTTTICRLNLRGGSDPRSRSRASGRAFYARSCKRTSENPPFPRTPVNKGTKQG